MNPKEIEDELKKVKFHIETLADTLDVDQHPVESLIITFDWSNEDLDTAHNIFEKYDDLLQNKKKIRWSDLVLQRQNSLLEKLGSSTVSEIIQYYALSVGLICNMISVEMILGNSSCFSNR